MSVFDSIEQIGRIAASARDRRGRSFPTSAEFRREQERQILAYLCSWETFTPGSVRDGSPCWNSFQRGAFDRQLAERKPEQIRFVVAHMEGLDIGFWGALMNDSHGLKGLAVPDDSPATFELIQAINHGKSTHVSLHVEVIRSRERQKPGREGWPVHDIVEGRITEAGPCPTGMEKDPGATILEVGGLEPAWIGEVERSKVMNGLRPVPTLNH